MSSYAALNPFVSTSVGENDLWNAASFLDVPYIHSVPFGALRIAVDQVRAQGRTQARFVRGAGGSGKSHLFARLRRECADGILYAYAPNPPLQPEALESFILARFVSSLRHPARGKDGQEAPFSQLRLLAYVLLKPVVEQELTFAELHEAWADIALESRKELIHQAVQLLEAEHPMVPRSVLRCLLNVLREDKEHLAAQWLSGAAYLTENELKFLMVQEPLARAEVSLVLQLFGRLAAQAGLPVVLVLDQLDLVSTREQFDEVQRLLFSLIDQSQNWVVLIGLVAERYAAWDAALTQALRGRIGVPDANAPLGFRLPVIDMLPIANEQKHQLLTCRLESPELVLQRKKDGITSAIHPLLPEDIARLTAGGAIFPRHLLAAAAEIYALRVTEGAKASAAPVVVPAAPAATPSTALALPMPPPLPVKAAVEEAVPVVFDKEDAGDKPAAVVAAPAVPPPLPEKVAPPSVPVVAKTPLAEKIDALLQQAVDATKAETVPPNAIDLGERARDLIELMVAPPVTITEGDIRKTYDNFDGSDRWFAWGGGKVRVVTTDSMRGSFIAVLERVKEAGGDTLLLRNDIAPVSGQLTMELLNVFKARNTFHHIPASEAAVLAGLGRILAAQREGSYEQLATEPAATKDNVLAALRNHPLLRGLRLWEMLQRAQAPKPGASASVLATIARSPAAAAVATAPPAAVPPPAAVVPAAPPPPVPAAKLPAPVSVPVSAPVAPQGAKPPPPPSGPVAKPVARPPSPLSAGVIKPVARPPSPPVAKPPPGVPRPPMSKLPPPSKGNAA